MQILKWIGGLLLPMVSCPRLSPGVVWFGESIPPEALSRTRAALDCDVCIAVGTSAVVYPAAANCNRASMA